MLELAIIRALLNTGNSAKIIYMAPTKSLCSERAKDWENKFKPFGIECKLQKSPKPNSTRYIHTKSRQRIYWRYFEYIYILH